MLGAFTETVSRGERSVARVDLEDIAVHEDRPLGDGGRSVDEVAVESDLRGTRRHEHTAVGVDVQDQRWRVLRTTEEVIPGWQRTAAAGSEPSGVPQLDDRRGAGWRLPHPAPRRLDRGCRPSA